MTRLAGIVIPTLNEGERVGGLIAQLSRLPTSLVTDILIADGRSLDDTRTQVAAAARHDSRVRLIDNPMRLQAAGVNRAAEHISSRADTLIRIDAHAAYPDSYVADILLAFDRTGADVVATRLRTVGTTCMQRGIAAAQNSAGGTGGSAHRVGNHSGWIDHGHHAGFDLGLFRRVGGYDESFASNEDAEFDIRARRAGGRIWLAGDIEADYVPRATLVALGRQYRRYGEGRARTYLKHGERLRPRQVIPPMLTMALATSVLATPAFPLTLVVPALYLALLVLLTAHLLRQAPVPCTLAALPAMATMHLTWGCGFLWVLVKSWLGGGSRKNTSLRPSTYSNVTDPSA